MYCKSTTTPRRRSSACIATATVHLPALALSNLNKVNPRAKPATSKTTTQNIPKFNRREWCHFPREEASTYLKSTTTPRRRRSVCIAPATVRLPALALSNFSSMNPWHKASYKQGTKNKYIYLNFRDRNGITSREKKQVY